MTENDQDPIATQMLATMRNQLDERNGVIERLEARLAELERVSENRDHVAAAQRNTMDQLLERNRTLMSKLDVATINGFVPEEVENNPLIRHMLEARRVLWHYYLNRQANENVAKDVSERLDLGLVLNQNWTLEAHKRECVAVVQELLRDGPLCDDEARKIDEQLGLGMDFDREWTITATVEVEITVTAMEEPDGDELTSFIVRELGGYSPYDDGYISVDITDGPNISSE